MKRCGKCGIEKNATDFHKHRSCKDGLRPHCKSCHYKDTRKKLPIYVARNREFVIEYLLKHPCVDCGYSNVLFLEFDHIRDKKFGVAQAAAVATSLDKLKKEIEKCEVRCDRCHRMKTIQRAKSFWNEIRDDLWPRILASQYASPHHAH